MSRQNFAVEQGYDIFDVNGNILASQLAGAAAPGGDAGPQDAAPVGSSYQRTDGTYYIKTASANAPADWSSFTGVLSGGYTPANGDPTAGDSFETAIGKLDANQDDIQTALGIAQGDTNFGVFTGTIIDDNQTAKAALQDLEDTMGALVTLTGVPQDSTDLGVFTGNIIPDNVAIKPALQALETEIENISGGTIVEVTGITAEVTVDSVMVDDVDAVEWEIVAFEESSPANKIFQKVTALHNGTASADASGTPDNTIHTKLREGANFNLAVDVDLNGVGAAQEMRLRVSSSTAGVTVRARRTTVV